MEGCFTEVTPTDDHFVYSMFEGLSRDLWHPFLTGTLGYSEAHAAKIIEFGDKAIEPIAHLSFVRVVSLFS